MIQVAVGVIQRDGKVLICQRKQGGRYAFKWEFPGGKLEPGETVEQCLRRELFEELSVRIGSVDLIETRSSYYEDGGLFEVAYCRVRDVEGEIRNNVFEDVRWVSLEELRSLDILEGNKPFIATMKLP
jgi:8-oxo-dGTP diphosphatase